MVDKFHHRDLTAVKEAYLIYAFKICDAVTWPKENIFMTLTYYDLMKKTGAMIKQGNATFPGSSHPMRIE